MGQHQLGGPEQGRRSELAPRVREAGTEATRDRWGQDGEGGKPGEDAPEDPEMEPERGGKPGARDTAEAGGALGTARAGPTALGSWLLPPPAQPSPGELLRSRGGAAPRAHAQGGRHPGPRRPQVVSAGGCRRPGGTEPTVAWTVQGEALGLGRRAALPERGQPEPEVRGRPGSGLGPPRALGGL